MKILAFTFVLNIRATILIVTKVSDRISGKCKRDALVALMALFASKSSKVTESISIVLEFPGYYEVKYCKRSGNEQETP